MLPLFEIQPGNAARSLLLFRPQTVLVRAYRYTVMRAEMQRTLSIQVSRRLVAPATFLNVFQGVLRTQQSGSATLSRIARCAFS